MGRDVVIRKGAPAPVMGDVVTWSGEGWEPGPPVPRPHNVTHVHTETVMRVVMGPWQSPDFASGASGWAIFPDGSAEFNDVEVRGTVYAQEGEIGGWTIATGHLYAGAAAARCGLKPGEYPFYAGSETPSTAPFRVNPQGEVWATNAHVTGEIDAGSGHLGDLDVDGVVTVGTGTPVIRLDGPNKWIESSNFVPGMAGFRIKDDGDAEFNNVVVRGEIRAAVLKYNEIHAQAGQLLVTPNAAKLESDLTVATSGSFDVGEAGRFAASDIVRLKDGTYDTWLTVTADNGDGTYSYTYASGSTGVTFTAGAAVVSYGASGEGGVLLDAVDANGPFVDIFTHAGSPWTGLTCKARLGRLDGISDVDLDPTGYGLYSDNVFLKGELVVGGGDVVLDADGIALAEGTGTPNSVRWMMSSSGFGASVYGREMGDPNARPRVALNARNTNTAGLSQSLLEAMSGIAGATVELGVVAEDTGDNYAYVDHSIVVGAVFGTVPNATLDVRGDIGLEQLIQFRAEISDPAAPAANRGKFYIRDNGAGKTQLCVRFATGAVQVLATEP